MENASKFLRGGGIKAEKQLSVLFAKIDAIDRALESNQRIQTALNEIVQSKKGITEDLYYSNIVDLLSEERNMLTHRQGIVDQIDTFIEERNMERPSWLGRLAIRLFGKN